MFVACSLLDHARRLWGANCVLVGCVRPTRYDKTTLISFNQVQVTLWLVQSWATARGKPLICATYKNLSQSQLVYSRELYFTMLLGIPSTSTDTSTFRLMDCSSAIMLPHMPLAGPPPAAMAPGPPMVAPVMPAPAPWPQEAQWQGWAEQSLVAISCSLLHSLELDSYKL